MTISKRTLEERVEEAEKLVLELASWCSYENSGCAQPETIARIRIIRIRRARLVQG